MMALLWLLSVSLLPLLALWGFGAQICTEDSVFQDISPELESLQCYNDYTSHIHCRWTEGEREHQQAPMSLYHLESDESPDSGSLCLPYGDPTPGPAGQLTLQCRYNTSLFAIGIQHAFFFKTPLPSELSRSLSLSRHVKVRPPGRLSQSAVEGGARLLNWQSPLPEGSPLHPSLVYQVSYRRPSQDWTFYPEVSANELKIDAESLVPGCRYEARVRARGGGGLWSEWSPPVEWLTEEASVPAGPFNLLCVFDGETEVNCSWEVKRQLAQFVTYNLSYSTNRTEEAQWCCGTGPVHGGPDDTVLRFSCAFSTSGPQELQVQLVPKYNSKVFRSHKRIRPSSPNPVQISERGRDWVLRWTPPESKVSVSYQVCYWSAGTQDDMRCYNFSQGAHSHVFSGNSLLPSTRYLARVRALVTRTGSYFGPPSEWAEPVSWTTHAAPWSFTTFLYVIISVLVAILFITLYFTMPAFHRMKVRWEVSLPSPLKSKVLEEVLKRSPSGWTIPLKEQDCICKVQVLDSTHLPRFSEKSWDAAIKQHAFSTSLPRCEEKQNRPDTSSLSFSGPYILCPTFLPSHGDANEGEATRHPSPGGAPSRPSSAASLVQLASEYTQVPSSFSLPQTPPGTGVERSGISVRDGYVAGPFALARHPEAPWESVPDFLL